jgi:hypothetical protein
MLWEGPSFTPVSIQPIAEPMRYGDSTMLLGSCFTEHIGDRLRLLKYNVNENPFGILYNPVSLANAIHRIIHQRLYTESELVNSGGLYHSMDHHGSFSGVDPSLVIERINASIQEAHNDFKKARFIFISPGTSIVYRYKATDSISGNCHKIPQAEFIHYALSHTDCTAAFLQMRNDINAFAPQAQVIWTISPVRHLSEGLIQNQRSKAQLIISLTETGRAFSQDRYFPAYEIMIDQLRDYRYYTRDMTHPSSEAIEIIWNAFKHMCMDDGEFSMHDRIEKIHRAMSHRFLHDQPEAQRKFAEVHLQMIRDVMQRQPLISFEKESAYFHSLI